MGSRLTLARVVTERVWQEARAENLTFMAGSIAYHAFVSLLPFLALVLFLVSTFGDEAMATSVVELAETYFTPGARSLLSDAVTDAPRSASVSIVGLLVLVWGTLKIFRSLDTAFSDIYESGEHNSTVDQFVDGAVALVAVGVAVLLAAVSGLALRQYSFGPATVLVNYTLLTVGLTVAFFPMYYLFPDLDVTAREVLPGTVVAAVGWAGLRVLFQVYVDFSTKSEVYGLVGGIIVLVTWLYFSGLVLLFGAALNAVLSGRSQDVVPIDWENPEARLVVRRARNTDSNPVPDVVELQRHLERADGDLRLVVDRDGREETVNVRSPDRVTHDYRSVSRPELLGGESEEAELVMRWDG